MYFPPPEHGHTIHCDSSYHGLMSGNGVEAGTVNIKVMVGAARSEYPRDKIRACISGSEGGGGTEELEGYGGGGGGCRIGKDGGRDT